MLSSIQQLKYREQRGFQISFLSQIVAVNSYWIIVSMGRLGKFFFFKTKISLEKEWVKYQILFLLTNVWLSHCLENGVILLFRCVHSDTQMVFFGLESHRLLVPSFTFLPTLLPSLARMPHSVITEQKTAGLIHSRHTAGHVWGTASDRGQLLLKGDKWYWWRAPLSQSRIRKKSIWGQNAHVAS